MDRIMQKKIPVMISAGVGVLLLTIVVIIIVVSQQPDKKTDSGETKEVVIQDVLKTKAELSADKYMSSLDTDFTLKSATTIYEDGDFAVIEIERGNEKWTIRGPAITKRGEVIIPPNIDYEQTTVDQYNIPDSVIQAMENASNND